MNLTDQTLEYWTERAKQLAIAAHEGQKRRQGTPYIEHPARVAAAVEARLKPIAWLHDVVEDTNLTTDDLKKAGFPSYVINAIDLLTHKKEDTNMVYWKKILTNPDAAAVKVADLKDNLSDQPNEYQKQKYAKALKLFSGSGISV